MNISLFKSPCWKQRLDISDEIDTDKMRLEKVGHIRHAELIDVCLRLQHKDVITYMEGLPFDFFLHPKTLAKAN